MLCPIGGVSVVTIFHWRNVKQFTGLANITITGSPASAGFHLVQQLHFLAEYPQIYRRTCNSHSAYIHICFYSNVHQGRDQVWDVPESWKGWGWKGP